MAPVDAHSNPSTNAQYKFVTELRKYFAFAFAFSHSHLRGVHLLRYIVVFNYLDYRELLLAGSIAHDCGRHDRQG